MQRCFSARPALFWPRLKPAKQILIHESDSLWPLWGGERVTEVAAWEAQRWASHHKCIDASPEVLARIAGPLLAATLT